MLQVDPSYLARKQHLGPSEEELKRTLSLPDPLVQRVVNFQGPNGGAKQGGTLRNYFDLPVECDFLHSEHFQVQSGVRSALRVGPRLSAVAVQSADERRRHFRKSERAQQRERRRCAEGAIQNE